jgi:hypothetical protein
MVRNSNIRYTSSLELYRSEAMKAAEELCYGYDVVVQIRTAKTEAEIARIMSTCRQKRR